MTAAAQRTGFFRFEGHRIAFAVVGTGAPLVFPAWWVSNVIEDWKDERFRRFVAPLARERLVVRYDRLGCGMSDRDRPRETLTLDYEVALLAALIDHLALDRLTLVGGSFGGCTAVAYAARNPRSVDRLVLYGSYADGATLAPAHMRRALVELVRTHWGLGSRMLADVFVPSGPSEERDAFAAFQRRSARPETAGDLLELMYIVDTREPASELTVPALVVHRTADRAVGVHAGEELAALIPEAEFLVLEGDAHPPWFGDSEALVEAIAAFLGIAASTPARERPRHTETLSPRERDVLRLVAEGLSDSDIAERLVLSPHTVHRHVANILRKLGLHSRAAAAAHAARSGLA